MKIHGGESETNAHRWKSMMVIITEKPIDENLSEGGCPKQDDNRGMPYTRWQKGDALNKMIIRKDRQMGLTTMKSARDMANPKRGECPKSSSKGVCPSVTTHKDQKIDRAVRKYTKDLMNWRMRVCLSVMTHEDQEVDRVVRESVKDPMNSRMRVCPSVG